MQRLRNDPANQTNKILGQDGINQQATSARRAQNNSGRRLKVGIDFGTTYSGVAWTYTGNQENVEIIRDWPGAGRHSDKVPTEISYTETGAVHKWGFEIKSGEERAAWFKLLLDPEKYDLSNSHMIARTKALMRKRSKNAEDVVADYLRCLKDYATKRIERTYGKAFMNTTPIDYILTVPAIWSDRAKNLTQQAAQIAGFGSEDEPAQLISEPEAAAAWTILKDINPNNFKRNDAFVIVDCGGGTVDLISYQIEKLNPLTLKECATGKGGLCGSTFLNQGFEDLVRSRAGAAKYDGLSTSSRNGILKEFEEVLKRSFSDSEDDEFSTCASYGLPDDPDAGIEDGEIVLTREDMKGIFDPVIDKIIPLVQDQINTVRQKSLHLTAVLLVGGFGASKYLHKRLEAELKRTKNQIKNNKQLELLQPANAWSSVARGAALGIKISSRKARKHYGVATSVPFNTDRHPIETLYRCPFDGTPYCRGLMRWYINKGDELKEDVPKSVPFVRKVANLDSLNESTADIIECEEDTPPEYIHRGLDVLKASAPINSTLPLRAYQRTIGVQMVPYYLARYKLEMTLASSAMLVFHEDFEGTKYKAAQVKYIHE